MFDKRTFITLLGMLAVSTAINPDNICALVADGTKIVDDTSCSKFYTCNQGKATSGTCPSGQYFSKDNKSCIPQAQASCVSVSDNPCAGITGEKFVAKANSCTGYYYCNNGVAQEGTCPNGLNFNPTKQACQYPAEYPCTVTGDSGSNAANNPNIMCAYIPNGMYFGSASNCKTWLKCKDNIASSGTCDPYVFNVQIQECVYASNYNCQQLNGDSSETGGAPAGSCTTEGEIKADPDSCSSYLICTSLKYETAKCASGQYFDPVTSKCTSRNDAQNDCDRCEGTTLKFVNAYQDNCQGYLVCSNGKTVGKGTCDSGYYFNEEYASCIKGANPNFKVCSLPLSQCADCTIYDAGCGTTCTCTTCLLQPCSDCTVYDEKCGATCTCATCELPPCSDCTVYDEECGATCTCATCVLPPCVDCTVYDAECGTTCECATCVIPPCADCTVYDAGCGTTCECATCVIPPCADCSLYDAECGTTCTCATCALPPCADCSLYDAECGTTCTCATCALPPCADCSLYDAECGTTCTCATCAPAPCGDCSVYDAECGTTCTCATCVLPPCGDCTVYDAECGTTCECATCVIPPCADCTVYDAGCGTTCECATCALPPCGDCTVYDTECGTACTCDTCILPLCTDCGVTDPACDVTCTCDTGCV